jgi:hypothetical protein
LELYFHYMTVVHLNLSQQLEQSIKDIRKLYDMTRSSIEPCKKGELDMLNGRNIWAKHCCKKLEDKIIGMFVVLATANTGRCCTLQLSEMRTIHSTLDIALTERY